MTRKEAKEILWQSKMQCEYPHGAYGVAVDMAIKALEQEPCEVAVSRQAAIDALDTILWGVEWDKALATAMLKDLPPVTPQPKTGHWVLLDECSNSGYYCSECHKKLVKEGWSDTVKKIKFCPNCGAKMESEE